MSYEKEILCHMSEKLIKGKREYSISVGRFKRGNQRIKKRKISILSFEK